MSLSALSGLGGISAIASSGNDIAAAYKAKVLALSPLFAFWGEEESGSTMTDSANGYNGSYAAAVVLGNDVSPVNTPCPTFDGTANSNGVSTNAAIINGLNTRGPYTYMIWWKSASTDVWTDANAYHALGAYYNSGSRSHFGKDGGAGKFEAYYRCLNLTDNIQVTPSFSPDTAWHCAVIAASQPVQDNIQFWLDGSEVSGSPKSGLQAYSHALNHVVMGNSQSSQTGGWVGSLWGFVGWNSYLSDANIQLVSTLE